MELQMILNVVNQMEIDLAMVKKYLLLQSKFEKQPKLNKKQLMMERVTKMLVHQKILDKRRAEKMFKAKKEELERKLKLLGLND